jgi:hypothetical protein
MCTVTVQTGAAPLRSRPDEPVLRVVCNRDELRTRPDAAAPAVTVVGGRRVVMPIDVASGGTWIAGNDCGLVFVLLNAYPPRSAAAPQLTAATPASRGLIIPILVSSSSVSEALERALRLDTARFPPFRLMLLERYQLAECWTEDGRLRHRRAFLQAPLMRTSSSLGDALVSRPRRALFRRFTACSADPRAAQDAFHDHQWPGAGAISVRMERPDARTVSRTCVEVFRDVMRVRYSSFSGGQDETTRLSIPLVPTTLHEARCS